MRVHTSPPPSIRKKLWEAGDPEELRRAADEWESLGFSDYAAYLRAWADGDRPPPMPSPW